MCSGLLASWFLATRTMVIASEASRADLKASDRHVEVLRSTRSNVSLNEQLCVNGNNSPHSEPEYPCAIR